MLLGRVAGGWPTLLTTTNEGAPSFASGSVDAFRTTPHGDIKLTHEEFKDVLAPYQRPDGPADAVITVQLKKSDFSPSELTTMETDTTKQFLFLKGSFSYKDGFDTPPSETPFCFSWMAYPPVGGGPLKLVLA